MSTPKGATNEVTEKRSVKRSAREDSVIVVDEKPSKKIKHSPSKGRRATRSTRVSEEQDSGEEQSGSEDSEEQSGSEDGEKHEGSEDDEEHSWSDMEEIVDANRIDHLSKVCFEPRAVS